MTVRKEQIADLLPDPEFERLLREAVGEALNKGVSSAEPEDYGWRFCSKDTALLLKRSRRVVGRCSQDTRPHRHTQSIAVLSAETAKWPVFLRAHLDIMNDRFERVTDGSYAWGRGSTYIGELEVLDIN